MRRLPLLRTTVAVGLCSTLLLNCSSSEDDPADGRNANAAASSDGSGNNNTSGPTGAGGTGATSTAATNDSGSGATSSTVVTSDSGSSNVTTDGSSATNTTGPLFQGGVGGTFVGDRDQGTTGDACQGLAIEFTPDIPTVFILVDRSSSMWDNMFWDPLRDGVLEVVSRLHEDVRFGFATFTGLAGNTCPLDLQDVGIIDRNNYTAIEGFYTPIMHPGASTETPTPVALRAAADLLITDYATFPGPKFIMLVTDGNPDYCDNGDAKCRADTTVRVLQDIKADPTVPIRTFVVGLPDASINQDWMAAFANAGAGESVAAPVDTEFCDDLPAATAALLPGIDPTVWPSGTYGATMGPELPYAVDPAQQDQLVEEISSLIAGVKSCIFDLEGELQIVEGREDEGSVTIRTVQNPAGAEQPYDPTGVSGWKVNYGTQIELVGDSCTALRDPETVGIDFGFPCEIIIPK